MLVKTLEKGERKVNVTPFFVTRKPLVSKCVYTEA